MVVLCAVGSFSLLAGCGGSGTNENPVVSSSTSAALGRALVTVARFSPPDRTSSEPAFEINWTPLPEVDTADISQYLVLRDGSPVGSVKPDARKYIDEDNPFMKTATVGFLGFYPPSFGSASVLPATPPPAPTAYYQAVGTASVPVPLLTPKAHVYTVIALIKRTVKNQVVYEQRLVGVSDPAGF